MSLTPDMLTAWQLQLIVKQQEEEITRLRAEIEQAQMRDACAVDLAREWEHHCKRAEAKVEKLKAALRLRADAEEHCLDAINYVGRYNSGARIEEARGRVRNAFTDFEEAEREALGDAP